MVGLGMCTFAVYATTLRLLVLRKNSFKYLSVFEIVFNTRSTFSPATPMILARRALIRPSSAVTCFSVHQTRRSICAMDYSTVPTPAACYADFCLIPVSLVSEDDIHKVNRRNADTRRQSL